MKHIITPLLFLLIFSPAYLLAQEVSGELVTSRSSSADQFDVNGMNVTINSSAVSFPGAAVIPSPVDVQVSTDYSMLAALTGSGDGGKVELYGEDGTLLNTISGVILPDDDPSLAILPLANGQFLVRKNIVNFSLYDSYGNIKDAVSNSSQSEKGETISQMTASEDASTIVLYNPRINYEGSQGSRASILDENGYLNSFFSSLRRTIVNVTVAAEGHFILVTTREAGTDDEVTLYDRFGNKLREFSIDEELKGVTFGLGNFHIAAYSSGRVLVYNIFTGDRLGAASIRGNGQVLYAGYSHADRQVLALTGARNSNGMVSGGQVHAVHLEKRKIGKATLNGNFKLSEDVPLKLERRQSDLFRISGTSRPVSIETRF